MPYKYPGKQKHIVPWERLGIALCCALPRGARAERPHSPILRAPCREGYPLFWENSLCRSLLILGRRCASGSPASVSPLEPSALKAPISRTYGTRGTLGSCLSVHVPGTLPGPGGWGQGPGMTQAHPAWWPGCGIWAGDLSVTAARLAWVVPAGTLCSSQSRTGHGAILDSGVVGLGRQHGFGSLLISSPAHIFGCAGCWSPAPCHWRSAKPVPGAGVSIPSPWPGEQRGSAAPHGLLALGFSLGHPAAQAPQNPRTLGQEGPQEGAQSFRTSSLEPAGSSQAEPGHPLIWGGSGQPRTRKGGLAAADGSTLGQAEPQGTPKQGQWTGRSNGLAGQEATLRVPKTPPRQEGTPGHVAGRMLLCRFPRTSAPPPSSSSSSGSIKIMSRAN